jgi:hypothetical protein
MQALVCRLSPEGVTAAVPNRLLAAGSTYAAIDFLELCHQRLVNEADRFGYDVCAAYTVVVQTWDRASDNLRSLAYGRANIQRDLVKLIPDVYFLNSDGYKNLRNSVARNNLSPWNARLPTVVWRGSVTGSGPYTSPLDIPRVNLAVACRGIDGTDVAIFQVHETMWNIYPPEEIERFCKSHGLWGERWPLEDFAKFKFALDIDGHANAWGLLEKLILGCCVLKVSSAYEQWFYEQLRPWKHYVPISGDLSDLERTIAWCRENQSECEWIARNGVTLARSVTLDSAVYRGCFDVISAASLRAEV